MGEVSRIQDSYGIMPLPSVERLRELFSYDPDIGEFVWLIDRGPAKAGTTAGYLMPSGYRYIRVDMIKYAAHRLVWKYMMGLDPPEFIDHINGNKSDNRISNLRLADTSENLFNRRKSPASKGPFKGVVRITQKRRVAYSAMICARGVKHFIGNFATAEEARAAYWAKAREIHGEFANVG